MGFDPEEEADAVPPLDIAVDVSGAALDLLRAAEDVLAAGAEGGATGWALPSPRACASAHPHDGRMSLAYVTGGAGNARLGNFCRKGHG